MKNSQANVFIFEGGNATGKTSTLRFLKSIYKTSQTLYALDKSFQDIRSNAYDKWSPLASFHYYIGGNLATIKRIGSGLTFFDRSIISTFAMYFSRIDESEWEQYSDMFLNLFGQFPKIRAIVYMKASESARKQRIKNKTGEAQSNDMKELKYEAKQIKAREYLLDLCKARFHKIKFYEITTSSMNISQIQKEVIGIINRESPPELTLLLGVSGCGKSYYCEENIGQNHMYKIVSSNQIMDKHYPNEDYSEALQEKVLLFILNITRNYLLNGYKVVVDTTFFNKQISRKRLTDFLLQKFEFIDTNIIEFSINEELSIHNDQLRDSDHMVGADIIKKQSYEFESVASNEYYTTITHLETWQDISCDEDENLETYTEKI